MTKIIAVTGAKGGVGKSTVTLLLAWEFSRRGKTVAVIDADIQGSSISAKVLNPEIPFSVVKAQDRRELWEKSKEFNDKGLDFVLVDTNPRSSFEDPLVAEMLATLSDLTLVLSRPSPRDLKAQIKFSEMLKEKSSGKLRLVWNFVQPRTATHKAGMPEGESLLGIRALKSFLSSRISYQDVGFDEADIRTLGNKAASREAEALASEIIEFLKVGKDGEERKEHGERRECATAR
jgi:cellulose biosynthesis protein BcsQ